MARMENARKYIDASITAFPDCLECPHEHHKTDKDDLCAVAMSTDGLPVRCVGKWASQKIYYLLQYFQIFTEAMKDKWAGNIRYIEVCSGPGRCCTRDKHEQDGTALAVLKHPLFRHHKHALFFDFSENVITTLSRRIDALGLSQRAHAILGDFNKPDTITSAMRYYGAGCLTLCLIDPTECNLPFETVRQIYEASGRKCDFIISFFEQNDFNRNGCDAVTNPSFIRARKKYSEFLGDYNFVRRSDVRELGRQRKNQELSALFRECYASQLAGLGLKFHDWKTIGQYYRLLYATANEKGIDFWEKCCKVDFTQQMELGI